MTSTNRMEVDKDRINALDAFTFAKQHQLIKKGKRKDRFFMSWEVDGEADVAFDKGVFHSHRHGVGGNVVDLVAFWLEQGPPKPARYNDALRFIAEKEGLWKSFAPHKQRAKALQVAPPSKRPWHEEILADLQGDQRRFKDSWAEAKRLITAMGVPWEKWSAAMQAAGGVEAGSMMLCWIPACPWLGMRALRKVSGFPGGWTKERIEEFWSEPHAGHNFVVDLDGLPRIIDVLRLRRALSDLGYPARAVVFSSWGKDDEHAKCHLYFHAKEKAPDEATFRRWHRLLEGAIRRVLDSWGQTEGMERDLSAHQITRLVRLPGFNKQGREHSGVVGDIWKGVVVDFRGHWETRPIHIGTTTHWWSFGAVVKAGRPGGPKDPPIVSSLAHQVWPLEISENVLTGAHGVRFRFHDKAGRRRYEVLEAASWVEGNAAKNAAKALAQKGVQILPGQGAWFVMALGEWSARADEPPMCSVITEPGWHTQDGQRVYVNGDRVHGAGWTYQGPKGPRTSTSGTLADWKAGITRIATTEGMWLALAASFAGALIQPLRRDSFIVHFAGASSSGKSLTTYLGGSVWYDSKTHYLTYNSTTGNLAARLEQFSGSMVVLDEMKHMEKPKKLGSFVHSFAEGKERGRLNADASFKDQRRWHLVGLSSGENTIPEFMGADTQGGHTVRAMDIRLRLGEGTSSADNAYELERFVFRHHGVAGDAWIAYLVSLDDEGWVGLAKNADAIQEVLNPLAAGSSENGRILRQLALCGAALLEAAEAGIVTPPREPRTFAVGLVRWALQKCLDERGRAVCPEARAWEALQALFESAPGRFPMEDEYRKSRGQDVVGITETDGGNPTGAVLTTEKLLKTSGVLTKSGCGPRLFIEWAGDKGWLDGSGFSYQDVKDSKGKRVKRRVGGVPAVWWRVDLSKP